MFLKVKVKTSARKENVEKSKDDTFSISVKEKAENNTANERVIEILKEYLHIKRARIVSGHHKPHKIVEVE